MVIYMEIATLYFNDILLYKVYILRRRDYE